MSAVRVTADQRLLLLGLHHDAAEAAKRAQRLIALADGAVPDIIVGALERDLVRLVSVTQKLIGSGLVRRGLIETAWAITQ